MDQIFKISFETQMNLNFELWCLFYRPVEQTYVLYAYITKNVCNHKHQAILQLVLHLVLHFYQISLIIFYASPPT